MRTRGALFAALLFMLGASVGVRDSAYVHGRVEADSVAGYTVRLWRFASPYWERQGWSTTNTSGQWGIGATVAGRYRATMEAWPSGGRMIGARYPGGIGAIVNLTAARVEFNVGASGNVGDIVFIWQAETGPTATATPSATPTRGATVPIPTTLYPPTVEPSSTPSGWVRPYGVISWFGTWSLGTTTTRALTTTRFLQLTEMWQWNVIEAARGAMGKPLGYLLDVRDDPLWLSGADMELGAQITRRFEVGPYEGMGFSQAIIVRERE